MEATKQNVTLEEAFKYGARHLMEGKYTIAERAFREILESYPSHFPTLYNLGLVYYSRRQWSKALQTFEKALKQNAGNEVCWNLLGFSRYKLGLNEQALEAFDKSIELKPDYDEPYKNKAKLYCHEEDFDKAVKEAKRATELNPESAENWFVLGNAYILRDELKEAMKTWEKALSIDTDFAKVWNNMGEALRQHGRLEEAEEKCRKALKCDPDYADAYANLGYILMERGRNHEAEDMFQAALEHRPQDIFALCGLCTCFMNEARLEEALAIADKTIKIDPGSAEAYLNAGKCLRLLGRAEEAEENVREALDLEPDSAEIHTEMAEVLASLDRQSEALALLEKARAMKIESPRLYFRLAKAYKEISYLDDAREMADKAVELNPEIPDVHYVRGTIYHFLGKLDESLECMRRTLALNPSYFNAYLSIGNTYLALGNKDKAEENIRKAMEIKPNAPEVYYALQSVKKFEKGSEDYNNILALEENLEPSNISASTALYFALYKVHEENGDYERAFEYLRKANDKKGSTLTYNPGRLEQFLDTIRNTFTAEFIKSKSVQGSDTRAPIFVIGMPRSGSTLTEQIISSHPQIFGAGETGLLSRVLRKYTSFNQIDTKEIGEQYVEAVRETFPHDEPHFVDKTLENYMYLGQIATALPHAKIIHSRRDPVDTALSCYKQNFAMGQTWAYDLENIAEQYKIYRKFIDHWHEVLPGRFLEIDYEETVNNFEVQARRLIDYIGLPWDDACLEPHKQKRQVLTASNTQVTQPVYQSSVKSWKRYEKQMKPFIDALGLTEEDLLS